MMSSSLRIGDYIPHRTKRESVRIRELNELCIARPTPHVHVLTEGDGTRCYSFAGIASGASKTPPPMPPKKEKRGRKSRPDE